LAVSFVGWNFRAPPGSADSVTVDAAPAAAGAAALVVAEPELELEPELEPVLELELELPQAPSASMAALASATVARRCAQRRIERVLLEMDVAHKDAAHPPTFPVMVFAHYIVIRVAHALYA